MAINRRPEEDDAGLPLVFSNGDLSVLCETADRLGFKDEESLLRYVLAVMSKAATRTLTVLDAGGKSVILNPSDSLLKPELTEATKPLAWPASLEKQGGRKISTLLSFSLVTST